MIKNIFKLIFGLMFMCGTVSAQEKKGDFLFKAMQDELSRNMKELSLPGMQRPFFMEYIISEGKQLQMNATLGSISSINEIPFTRGVYARVLVGNYHRSNAMYYETRRTIIPGVSTINTTIDDNYGQIRRDLWRQTDVAYKRATEEYVKKTAELKLKNLSPADTIMDDLSKVSPVNKIAPSVNVVIDKAGFIRVLEELSAVFKNYPDIENSEITGRIYSNDVYVLNSENSRYSFPNNMITIDVNAMDHIAGKVTTDKMSICVLEQKDLSSLDDLKAQINAFAESFLKLKNAQSIKDTYSGPVLFEGNAVNALFENELFSGSGVFATREPVLGAGNVTLQDKMDSKVISNEFTVKCVPFLKEYEGKKLVGHFDMDIEGIVPEKELTLIENGILKNIIGNRMPSKYNKAPSGYFRSGTHPVLFQGILCPGVIDISTSKGVSNETLKQLLLKTAKENGYNYAYIIRKLEPQLSGMMSSQMNSQMNIQNRGYSLTNLYRVNVADGTEEMIRDAELRDLRKGILKVVLGSSNKKNVINTNISSTTPVTYIIPDAVLLPDLEIAMRKDIQRTLPAVVVNPLKDKI